MKVTRSIIAAADPVQLHEIKYDLQIKLMKLDKFFTIFLDNAELEEEDTTTTDWKVYNEMTKEYQNVNDLIRTTDYYLGNRA